MAETKTKNMNHRKDIMCNTAGSLKEEQLVEVPSEAVLVRKRIGKQTFLVRVHFKKEGTENLHTKICWMLEEEVRNSGYA